MTLSSVQTIVLGIIGSLAVMGIAVLACKYFFASEWGKLVTAVLGGGFVAFFCFAPQTTINAAIGLWDMVV